MTATTLQPVATSTRGEELGRVLIVDDHPHARESMAYVLGQAGYRVDCVTSAIEALTRLESESVDVVVTDLQMPGMTGLELIERLQRRRDGAQIVMVTAHATISSAVNAIRHGAFDYIEKPFEADQLEQLVARALAHGKMLDQVHLSPGDPQAPIAMIGHSRAMQELRAKIAQIGPTGETVLITGESGTGKELVARSVHAASPRRGSPLVGVNSPGLSAHLMESELFGHERGAFTGADSQRTGRFELADGGTILFDEITEIDLTLQAKLLRVLQERSFERVGSNQTRHVDVRVLATTNLELLEEIAAGRFRQDLYYRLAVVPLTVPPLRERHEDVPALVDHFLKISASRLNREPCQLDSTASQLLCEYHWPGNVRELGNIITRASVLNQGSAIRADELRPWLIDAEGQQALGDEQPSLAIGTSLADMERKLIESTLDHYSGHRAKTADALGIGLRTLSGKLKQYGYAPRAKKFSRAG
ncbi:MAG: sigma-54-dependent transcriptional regulator [Pirellulales bacterium]